MVSFTPRFVLLLIAGAVCVLAGYFEPRVMYAVALYNSLLLWLALFDYFMPRPKLEVQRRFEERAGLGAEVAVELLFVNGSGRAACIEADDTPPEECGPKPDRIKLTVPPGSQERSEYTIKPMRRGDRKFGELFLRMQGRLGLVRRRMSIEIQQDTLKVYPDMSEFKKYELLIRKGYFYMPGLRPSRFRGRGTAFERLRDYQQDDDYHHINWKATARLSRPIVEEYEMDKNQNVFLMIDTGRLMNLDVFGFTKLDHALRTALVLASVCSMKNENVGLIAFSKDVKKYVAPGHGRAHLVRCMDALYNLEADEKESDYAHAFEYLLAKKLKRSLIIVFSDLVDLHASETLVKYLSQLSPKHLPMCVTLNDSDIADAARAFPDSMDDIYRKTAAMSLVEKRSVVFHRLERRGVSIIDTRPEKLSTDVIQKYLELKTRLMV